MSLIFTVTCDHVLYDWKCDGDSVNWSPPTSPPESHVYHTSKCILCTNTHRLTTQAGSHTQSPNCFFPSFFVPHSEQKHHIPLSDTWQKEPHLRANSGPAPELQHLLISAKFSGIKSLWILIFLFLLEPKHDLNTQSQCSLIRRQRDSVMTAEPGCVLTWPRFHSLIAAEVELALPLT